MPKTDVEEAFLILSPKEHGPYLQSMCPRLRDEDLKILCTHPLFRISYYWLEGLKHRGGLSPFGLAGITGRPPEEVLEQLEKEAEYFSGIFLCTETLLPICFPWYIFEGMIAPRTYGSFCNSYNEGLDDYFGCEEDIPENLLFENLLATYGGKNWKKLCHRNFGPAKQSTPISLHAWNSLKKFYLGSPLRRAKKVEPLTK